MRKNLVGLLIMQAQKVELFHLPVVNATLYGLVLLFFCCCFNPFRLIQMKAVSKESSAKERRRSKRKSKKKLNMMTKKML